MCEDNSKGLKYRFVNSKGLKNSNTLLLNNYGANEQARTVASLQCGVSRALGWNTTQRCCIAQCTTTVSSISVATKLNLKAVPYSIASLLSECFYAQVVWISSLRLAISSYFEVQLRVALLS